MHTAEICLGCLLLLLLVKVDLVLTVVSGDDEARPLDERDFENGQRLTEQDLYPSLTQTKARLDRQKYFRGDIRGKAAWKLKRRGVKRNGVRHHNKKWPNGRIPYVLSNQYTPMERALLARAFDEYHRRTCVRFVARHFSDYDYLYVGKIDGCFSDVGRAGGRQELSLDNGCLEYDTAIHELMHAVGFYHEHERWDRDDFIQILWQNIDRNAYDQFGKVELTDISYYGQHYDYYSIMHYDSVAFSKNGMATMVARQPHMTSVIGNAKDFSNADLSKINSMYSCGVSAGVAPTTAWRGGNRRWSGPSAPSTETPVGWNRLPPPPSSAAPLTATNAVTTLPNSACRDKTNLCWKWAPRCRSFFFERLMREHCPKTCGYCNSYVSNHFFYSNDGLYFGGTTV